MAEAPDWFHDAIVSGLQRLLVLRLRDGPAMDTARLTAAAWVDALAGDIDPNDPEGETARVAEGFRGLMRTRSVWPQPVHLAQAMPPRITRLNGLLAKPPPPRRLHAPAPAPPAGLEAGILTPERRAENLRRIAEIRDGITKTP